MIFTLALDLFNNLPSNVIAKAEIVFDLIARDGSISVESLLSIIGRSRYATFIDLGLVEALDDSISPTVFGLGELGREVA